MAPKRRAREAEASLPPAKMYKFIGNKNGYRTRQLLYQAVLDAKTAGKAPHWKFVDVVQNEEKDSVVLRCMFCQRDCSSRNPSESVGEQFTVVDGVQTCVVMKQQQECVNVNQEAAPQGTPSL
jgi:hypothetical protein